MNVKDIKIIKDCNNKLTVVSLGSIKLVFSYTSLIGIVYGSYLILNEWYNNYSVTTSKHIYTVLRDIYYLDLILVNPKTFENLIERDLKQNDLNIIVEYYKKSEKALEFLENLQYQMNEKLIDFKTFERKLYSLDQLAYQNEKTNELKTVVKQTTFYKSFSLSFEVVKTYNLKSKKLTNIKLYKLKENPISYNFH